MAQAGRVIGPAGGAWVDGYVWAYLPDAASYTAASGYERNSAGGAVEISRTGTGIYTVRFVGMAASGGVAHVRPYGAGNKRICTVANWGPVGADQRVSVRCFDHLGAPANSLFIAHFTNRSGGDFAYFWADNATSAVPYAPSAGYAYDSTGIGTQVWRQSAGLYLMQIGAVDAHYPGDHTDGVYQITAYGTAPVRCEVHGENDEDPTPIAVFCVDQDGSPADTRFAVSFSHGRSVLGTQMSDFGNAQIRHSSVSGTWWVDGWHSTGLAPGITRLNVGRYSVAFPGVAVGLGWASVAAKGSPDRYCAVASWSTSAVTVNCYDSVTDSYADSDFMVALTA
jgi:hypothetical protein